MNKIDMVHPTGNVTV